MDIRMYLNICHWNYYVRKKKFYYLQYRWPWMSLSIVIRLDVLGFFPAYTIIENTFREKILSADILVLECI